MFFFEKKNQKTSDCSAFGFSGYSEPRLAKVFCFFFFKKEVLASGDSIMRDDILPTLITTIRRTVNEDWIEDFPIGPQTRFHDDLELESIEFIKIADAVQARFGTQLDITGFLSGRSIQDLIALSVGDLADFIAGALPASGLQLA
jgi:acyl carrier protein